MDALTMLPIKKHPSLLKRFPATRGVNPLAKHRASWIVYGHYLTPAQFADMDFFTERSDAILALWQVGGYQVALMAGELTSEHETILQALELDYARIQDVPDLSKPGLMVLDMDSTAIQIECIDEIAKLAGVGEEVAQVTERAMQGELDFEQSLRLRVSKLKGAPEEILSQVRATLPLMPELPELVATLHALGWKVAIASGGFTYFSDHLKAELSLDYAKSNQLEIIDGKLTGQVLGEVVGAQTKADILRALALQYDIEMHNTVAVGDGANDLLMMAAAGLGVAFHAKPKVEAQAQTAVRFAGLGGVLCILSAALIGQQKLSWQAKPKTHL
ncbi:phosphoserine phosphatase [Vibrio misgurnus]|uniref:phosphoserine phosphatase n=1 Tax=Vibrio misgurnus TaxID=2993714 RepID=UPI0024165B39|nr:phosphoserine phosphatase [Vibrio sp. gvc]